MPGCPAGLPQNGGPRPPDRTAARVDAVRDRAAPATAPRVCRGDTPCGGAAPPPGPGATRRRRPRSILSPVPILSPLRNRWGSFTRAREKERGGERGPAPRGEALRGTRRRRLRCRGHGRGSGVRTPRAGLRERGRGAYGRRAGADAGPVRRTHTPTTARGPRSRPRAGARTCAPLSRPLSAPGRTTASRRGAPSALRMRWRRW